MHRSLGSSDVLGDGHKLGRRLGGNRRLDLGSSRPVRLLEKSSGTGCTLGSGLLRFRSLGDRDRRWAHVSAPFAEGSLGFRGSRSDAYLRG